MEQSETDETHGKIFQQGCVCVEVWTCACVCAYVHSGCMDRHQMKPIYILDVPVFIGELQHHSVLLTALASNWLTDRVPLLLVKDI